MAKETPKAYTMRICRKKLATIWFSLSGILFIILIIQTLLGRFGESIQEIWSWFLPTIMPTLSLIITVVVVDGTASAKEIEVDPFLFRLASILSVAYLFAVLATFLFEPFSESPFVDLAQQSSLYLGPFQGLTSASIGAFFVKKKSG